MKLVIVAVVLASAPAIAGPKFKDQASAQQYIERRNATEQRAFDARVAAERKKLGTAAFEPTLEHRERSDAKKDSKLVTHPKDPSVALRDNGTQLAYVTFPRTQCSGPSPQTVTLFARTARGVKIVIVEPEVRAELVRVPGSCGLPGCGIEPPPLPESDQWLGVANAADVTIQRVRVRYLQRALTCDRPSYPPSAPPH